MFWFNAAMIPAGTPISMANNIDKTPNWAEVVITDLPIANDVDKVRDYEIHCNHRSDHEIFLEEAVVPTYPVAGGALAVPMTGGRT